MDKAKRRGQGIVEMMARPETLQNLVEALAARGTTPCVLTVRGSNVSTWSCAEIGGEALRLARGLVAAGLTTGEPVVAIGPNTPELIVVRLALAAAGALAVPIDDLASADDVHALVRDSGARRAFTSSGHLEAVTAAFGNLGADIYVIDGEDRNIGWRTLLGTEEAAALPEQKAEEPTVLVYTSGTTGAPKGFTLSHANILHNVGALAAEGLIGADDRVLMPLPLHHAYPFIVGLLLPLKCGAAVVLPEAIRGPEIVQALKLGHATAMIGVPRLYEALVQGLEARVSGRGPMARALFRGLLAMSTWVRRTTGRRIGRRLMASVHRQLAPDLKLMASGGAHLEGKIIWTLEGLGWACYSGYGLAETASIFTGNLPSRQKIGSEGRPLPGGELRIADPDDSGIGEIQLRGPSVFGGYRNNEAANREAFTNDGWFRTGDLGRVDAEGYLYVTGRLKEMIVLGGGKNVFPEEIEAHFEKDSGLREVAVLERQGRLVALVVPDFDAIAKSPHRRVDDVVRVALAERGRSLPSFKRPAGFAIVRDPLPRTRLGKLRRHLLPSLYEEARAGHPHTGESQPLAPEDAELLSKPPTRDIWHWLQTRYADRGLSLDTDPALDLGIDSIEWVNLSLELEERFGVSVSEDQITAIGTLRDLLRMVDATEKAPGRRHADAGALAEAQSRYLRPARGWEVALGIVAFWLNRLLCRVFFCVEATGLEHVPRRGPYILIANHASDLDPLVLAASLPLRTLRHVWWGGAAERLFRGRVFPSLARAANIFPVEEWAPETSLALATTVLERGDALAWFPEGWRTPDGEIQRFLPGIGLIVERTGAPCVPVRITGTFEAMPRTARFPRPHKVRVRFGRPVAAAPLVAVARGAANAHQAIAEALRNAITACET